MEHPSILAKFESFKKQVEGKSLVVFLDYDGTLTPIVKQPDRAYMSDEMRQVVKKVSTLYPTAIISGRGREKVYEFVQLPELVYAGSHGMDISDGSSCRGGKAEVSNVELDRKIQSYCAAEQFKETMDKVCAELRLAIKDIPHAEVEHNKFCVSVHYRNCDPALWEAVQSCVEKILKRHDSLRMTTGRKVFEVRPSIEWDKGKAVEYLLDVFGMSQRADVLPIYIGDDRTDEDAFRVLQQRETGIGILVSKIAKDTFASYTLQDPSEVLHFLNLLTSLAQKRHLQ